VSKRDTDISQIRKYLDGELDARAMHLLERRAQDDPFLMDALEGFENAGSDQQAQLNELAGRLNQRVAKKERRIIPMRIIAIAASVLIIFSVGVWWLNGSHPANKLKIALNVKPVVKTTPAKPADTTAPNKQTIATAKAIQRPAVRIQKVTGQVSPDAVAMQPVPVAPGNLADAKIKDSVPKDITPLNETIVTEYTGKRKKDTTGSASIAGLANAKKARVTNPDQLLPGQAPGAADNNSPVTNPAKDMIIQGKTIAPKSLQQISTVDKNYASSKKVINGQVVSKDDGLPIPGATVRVKGTTTGVVTDVNGRFTLPADNNGSSLVIGFIGYQTQEVNAVTRDSMKTISLQPNNSSLAEVVVTNYNPKSNAEEPAVTNAHPKAGWSSFRKYLKENAHSPDGKTGVVKLSFTVDNNGAISNITIKKGISQATDQAAIDLVADGPDWAGNTNGKPETVSLKVKFVK
jgi:hypothetical protein